MVTIIRSARSAAVAVSDGNTYWSANLSFCGRDDRRALIELYLNGQNPLPPPTVMFNPPPARPRYPGDKAYAEAKASLLSMVGEPT